MNNSNKTLANVHDESPTSFENTPTSVTGNVIPLQTKKILMLPKSAADTILSTILWENN